MLYSLSIYLKTLTPCSLQERPPRGWPQQKSLHLSLYIHSLLACSVLPLLSSTLMHILPYSILPPYSWPSSPPRTCNFIHIYFLQELFTSLSLHMYFFSPISLHESSLSLQEFPCHIFLHAFFTHPPILSRHLLLSGN